LAEISRFRA